MQASQSETQHADFLQRCHISEIISDPQFMEPFLDLRGNDFG